MGGSVDGRTDRRMDPWMDGRTDGWIRGWTDGRMGQGVNKQMGHRRKVDVWMDGRLESGDQVRCFRRKGAARSLGRGPAPLPCTLLSPDAEGEPRPPAAHLAHVRSLGVLAPPLRSWGASFQERGIGGKEGTEAGESPRPRKGSVLGGSAGQTLTPSLAPALHGVGRGAAAAKPGDFGVQEVDRPRAGVQGRC